MKQNAPVLLGSGVPLVAPGAAKKLMLADQRVLPTSGIIVLSYSVIGGVGPAPRIVFIKSSNMWAKRDPGTVQSPKKTVAKKRAAARRKH